MTYAEESLWQGSMPEAYEKYLSGPIFAPHAGDLAERARQLAPKKVLEIGAGTGILTATLERELPDAQLTATDLNEAMVEFGSQRTTRAEWSLADAQALPFDDGSFDMVICQFGVMFFPDKQLAYREARRVLVKGGALLFNTWDSINNNDFARALGSGLATALPGAAQDFLTRVPHGYFDPQLITNDVDASGLVVSEVATVKLQSHADCARDIAMGFCQGTPIRTFIKSPEDVAEVVNEVTVTMEEQLGTAEVNGQLSAIVVTARHS